MPAKDFTITISVNKTPKEAFNAINNVRGWWSEEIDGKTDQLNEVFLYHYKDVHISKIKIIEFVPEKKVVWHVLENHFSFTKDQSEWTDTKIVFEITTKDNMTQVQITHQGLTPLYECYEICETAWTNYTANSLKNLIEKGKGEPNPKEGGYNEDLLEKWKTQMKF